MSEEMKTDSTAEKFPQFNDSATDYWWMMWQDAVRPVRVVYMGRTSDHAGFLRIFPLTAGPEQPIVSVRKDELNDSLWYGRIVPCAELAKPTQEAKP